MRLATQHILRVAAVLALTVASTSAFAQDDRRSFNDGYAAGQRASEGPRGEPGGPPGWARVRVEQADYGVRGRRCDARESVRREVMRNHGEIFVDNGLCGDPAHGAQKELSVMYRCGDSESVRVVAREGETLRLSCRR